MNACNERQPVKVCNVPGFGAIPLAQILAQDALFVVMRDRFPVSAGHSLIVPKRRAARFAELLSDEKAQLISWIEWCLAHLKGELRPEPSGFNVGVNDGRAAGQTIPQFHMHIIPRYEGDVPDPRGGIRWVIPNNAKYWEDERN